MGSSLLRRRLAAVAILLSLGVSIFYSARQALYWKERSRGPTEFEEFVEEVRRTIPAAARVRVTAGTARQKKHAFFLSTRLHPRAVVFEGPADWIIDLPEGEFRRSEASFRKAAP